MLILILCCMSPGGFWLQSAETADWSLANQLSVSADSVQTHSAGTLPPPVVTGSFAGSSIETRNGPVRGSIGVVQKIPWPGELRFLRDQAEVTYQLSVNQSRMESLRRRTETARLWCAAYRHREYLEYAQELSHLLESLQMSLSSSVAGVHNSPGLLTDLFLRTEIAALTPVTEQSLYHSAVNELTSYTEVTAQEMSEVPSPGWFSQRIAGTDFVPPVVIRAELETEMKRINHDLAGTYRLPDFTAGVSWSFIGEPEIQGGSESPGQDAWMISIGVTLPMGYSGFEERETASGFELLSAQAELEALKAETAGQLERYADRITSTASELELLQDLLPVSENSVENAASAWISGAGSYGTLISALETSIDLKKTITEKQISLILATAQWLELAGLGTEEGDFL